MIICTNCFRFINSSDMEFIRKFEMSNTFNATDQILQKVLYWPKEKKSQEISLVCIFLVCLFLGFSHNTKEKIFLKGRNLIALSLKMKAKSASFAPPLKTIWLNIIYLSSIPRLKKKIRGVPRVYSDRTVVGDNSPKNGSSKTIYGNFCSFYIAFFHYSL